MISFKDLTTLITLATASLSRATKDLPIQNLIESETPQLDVAFDPDTDQSWMTHNLQDEHVQSIIGGYPTEKDSRPYLLSIGNNAAGRHFCGASLISPSAVMTAAHCLFKGDMLWDPPDWVDFFRYNMSDDADVIRMELNDVSQCNGDVVYHPDYEIYYTGNDVAILFLPTPMYNITPVKLNNDGRVPVANGSPLDVSGWGATKGRRPRGYPDIPYAVSLDYVSNDDCSKKPFRWPEQDISNTMMCAWKDEKSACYGDSGGPVVLGRDGSDSGPLTPVEQVGIVSWGVLRCASNKWSKSYPSVFTRVSEVIDWVKDTVCARTGELCNSSKSSKNSKSKKKMYPACVKVPTYKPTESPTTYSPAATFLPTIVSNVPPTAIPTYMPSTIIPTWFPTEEPHGKANKL
ncbi:hypothetical protein ACHAW6_002096 [Cyclotella cf. meneghiniana]